MSTIKNSIVLSGILALNAFGGTVPERYGAAGEREDTTRGALEVYFMDTTDAGTSDPLWDIALSGSKIKLWNTMLSVKTGIYNHLKHPFSPVMQQLALSRTFRSTSLQLGIGYQPVQINEQWYENPVSISDGPPADYLSIDISKSHRFLGRINGSTDITAQRHLFYGAEIEAQSRSGIHLDRSSDYYYSDYDYNHDYVFYSESGEGDALFSIGVGAGYWKDFIRHEKQYKSLFIIEGFYNREEQALRFNTSIVSYMEYLKQNAYEDDYHYTVIASGMLNNQSGAGIRYILSNRFTPMIPEHYATDGTRNIFSGGIEHLDLALSYSYNREMYLSISETNSVPYTTGRNVSGNDYDSYKIETNYSWRLFINMPWSTAAVIPYLTGRVSYQSISELQISYHQHHGTGDATVNIWTGICSRLFKRLLLEVAYQPFRAGVQAYYQKEENHEGVGGWNLFLRGGGRGEWLLQVLLLY